MIAASALSRRLLPCRSQPPSLLSLSSCFPRYPRGVRRTNANAKNGADNPKSVASDASSKSFAERNPFLFQLGVATTKTSAADIMVQVVVDRRNFDDIDYKRNAIFVVFGFAYLGGFQYWLMVNQFSKWFPTRQRFAKLSLSEKLKDRAGMIDAARMVAFDVFVHLPLLYFPSYYACKEIVTGETWNPIDWVRNGCEKYWNNKEEDLTAMIRLWGPVDCIQFSMPIHYSMPFRHIVSFFWTAYISFTRGAVAKAGEEGEVASDEIKKL
ncbi:hypothetical protein ACHAXA_006593 [Cyclostephanos tholiformis]|jgi:hypothetical protein|uniref:Uncharacterized protein n=1 Tax=Cyclostephanos tholiformis TaxID=382380 RepID=A0ABD3R1F4_9STRA